MEVTYAETRYWATYLRLFTPRDLAVTMGVDEEVIEGYLVGLLFNGTIEDTGDRLNGRGPAQPIFGWVPLPRGPREHPHYAPEWRITPGCYSLAPRRGMPIRIRSGRDDRKGLSTPGQRHKMKMAEKRYHEAMAAKEKRQKTTEEKRKEQLARRDARAVKQAAKAERRREKKQERRLFA